MTKTLEKESLKKVETGDVQPENKLEAFTRVVNNHEGDFNIIVTQVDPDAVGSAIGTAALLEVFGRKSRIHYCGSFGHPQNRAIANKYNLKSEMYQIPADKKTHREYFKDADNFILVDSSLANDSRIGIEIDPIIVIDHHRGSDIEPDNNKFIWIEDVGSASTLVAELLQKQQEKGNREADHGDYIVFNKRLALLLALGIYTDTGALVSAGPKDRKSYAIVAQYITSEDILQLVNYTFPASHYRNMKRAMEDVIERDSRLIASLGFIKAEEGDDLSTIAEWFLRKDGISLVVVWGILGNKVRISARNSNISLPLDDFLKSRIGTGGAKLTPSGMGEGGAMLDLGPWVGSDNGEEIKAMVAKRIEEWILGDLEDSNTKD